MATLPNLVVELAGQDVDQETLNNTRALNLGATRC